jgi:hypothetical protein
VTISGESGWDIRYRIEEPPIPPMTARTTNLESTAAAGLGAGLTTLTVWNAL